MEAFSKTSTHLHWLQLVDWLFSWTGLVVLRLRLLECTVSYVPAGGGTARLYHTTPETAGERHSNRGWIMVGVYFLVIFGTAVEWLWSTSQPRRCCMPWKHTKSAETNLTSSLTNINVKNFSKVQNH